jgi:hypothetical protein
MYRLPRARINMLGEQKRQHRSVLINSANRDAVQYPNPNTYAIPFPYGNERVHIAYLATFIMVTPAAPPLTANLRIRELQCSSKVNTTWSGGSEVTLACIPIPTAAGVRLAYQPSEPRAIDILRTQDSTYFPSFTTLSISWTDENGALIANMPDHVMRLVFEVIYV